MGETPLSIAYGVKAIILVEIDLSLAMKLNFNEKQKEEVTNAIFDYLGKKGMLPKWSS